MLSDKICTSEAILLKTGEGLRCVKWERQVAIVRDVS